MLKHARPTIAYLILASLYLPFCAVQTQAQRQKMTVTIGRPNIWSLAQAHYLLANVRNTNRALKVASPGDLNPNSINGARMEILRTMLGVEAQFSAAQGLTNSVAQQQFQTDFARKQAAIARLDELSREHLEVIREISAIDVALSALGTQPAPDKRDPAVEKKREELTAQRAAKVMLRDAIAGQITTASTQANASAALSNLGTAMPLGTPSTGSLPADAVNDIGSSVTRMLREGMPDIDASQKLDNYIDMQYEVISKQLTLLRDETGPDERLVFLELPLSVYTVPKTDDDQIMKIDWNLMEYYSPCTREVANPPAEPRFLSPARADSILKRIRDAKRSVKTLLNDPDFDFDAVGGRQAPPITDEYLDRFNKLIRSQAYLDYVDVGIYFRAQEQLQRAEVAVPKTINDKMVGLQTIDLENISELTKMLEDHEELLRMGWTRVDRTTPAMAAETRVRRCHLVDPTPKQRVRVIDTIPRQSALSVNDVHATQKGFALTAKFLSLFGFGAQVSYQRQRSIYEQFINQDVFGSGFGKGTEQFGWTFGPVPGTNRLAPGPRTTFAILAIPKDTWQINIQATAKAFPRGKSPTDLRDQGSWKSLGGSSFDMLIPNEDTEGFWIDSIDYAPVGKGERVTALIKGDYFSPLTGVLVDGIPLKRVVAIAKHESDSTTLPLATDSPGEYEYLNQKEIIISFKPTDTTFVGTPLIALVTPEKTSVINFFPDLRINHNYTGSLQRYSLIEPMFVDDLSLDRFEIASANPHLIAINSAIGIRVYGKGFRRRSQVCLNDDCKADQSLTNSGRYDLRFNKPASRVWTLTYRVGQRVLSSRYDTQVDGLRSQSPSIESIENPSTNRPEGLVAGGYRVIIRGTNLENVTSVRFGSNPGAIVRQHSNVLLVTVPAGAAGGVEVLLEGTIHPAGTPVSNILDFMTPGKAMFKYVP